MASCTAFGNCCAVIWGNPKLGNFRDSEKGDFSMAVFRFIKRTLGMTDQDKFYDAPDPMSDEQQAVVGAVRGDVMPHLDKLKVEEAGDCLYSHLSRYKLDRDKLVEHILHTEQVHLFFRENPTPRDVLKHPDNSVKFAECIKILTGYAVMLLKPERMRPDTWDRISVNSHSFEETVTIFNEHESIITELGFQRVGANFVYKKSAKVTLMKIKEICFDLLLLTAYMEVKMGIEKSNVEAVAVPERSEIQRKAEPVKPGSILNCDMCSKRAYYYCETRSSKVCVGKAWCKPCNDKWHTNNEKRKDHKVVPLRPPPPIPDRRPSQTGPPTTSAAPPLPVAQNQSTSGNSPRIFEEPLPPLPTTKFLVTSPASSYNNGPVVDGSGYISAVPAVSQQYYPSQHNQYIAHDEQLGYGYSQPTTSTHHQQAVSYVQYNQPAASAHSVPVRNRPIPKPRLSRRSVTSPSQPEPVTPPTGTNRHQVAQGHAPGIMGQVEASINRLLESNDLSQIKAKTEMFGKSMKDLKVRMEAETDAVKKSHYIQELLKLNRIKTKLEDRVDELEMDNKFPAINENSERTEANVETVDPDLSLYAEGKQHFSSEEIVVTDPIVPQQTLQELSPLSYLKCVAEAEMAGYTIDEVLLGLLCVPFRDLNHWLQNTYATMLDAVQQAADTAQQELKFCIQEIKDAFVSHGLDHPEDVLNFQYQPIIDKCVRERREQVKQYLDFFNDPIDDNNNNEFFKTVHVITPEIVNDAIYNANGDRDEILWLLNDKVAEKIREFIWKPLEPDEMEDIGVGESKELVKKLAIQTLKDTNVDDGVGYMVSYAELGLSRTQANEVKWVMMNLLEDDEYEFEIPDVITAVKASGETNLHEKTKKYLSNECVVCCSMFPKHRIASLPCHDSSEESKDCCIGCARLYFEHLVIGKNVTQFSCPVCNKPSNEASVEEGQAQSEEDQNENEVERAVEAHLFFEGLLSIVFPNIGLSQELITKFNKKVTCWKISTDPNFYWCQNVKCSEDGFGFIDDGVLMRITCPECRKSTCRKCRKEWVAEHEQRTCEEFTTWQRENTEEYLQGEALRDQMIEEQGIQCPKCNSKFHLSRGGCMHCTCLTCQYQFCSGCGAMFSKNCPKIPELKCQGKGFHGHHPRNCYYYIRDFSVADLQRFLTNNSVQFESGKKEERCVREVENDDQVVAPCGGEEEETGLCRKHYIEYLSAVINTNRLEVLTLMPISELRSELRRNGKEIPGQEEEVDEEDNEYREQLVRLIKEELPFKDLSAFKNF